MFLGQCIAGGEPFGPCNCNKMIRISFKFSLLSKDFRKNNLHFDRWVVVMVCHGSVSIVAMNLVGINIISQQRLIALTSM